MKKPYSLAQRKCLKQIQYSLNLQGFNSSWIQKKKSSVGFKEDTSKLGKRKKQEQPCSRFTTTYFIPYLYHCDHSASLVCNLNHDQLSLTVFHLSLSGSCGIFWHCYGQTHYREDWCQEPSAPHCCLLLICIEQEAWWNVLGYLEGWKRELDKTVVDLARVMRSSLASSLCALV